MKKILILTLGLLCTQANAAVPQWLLNLNGLLGHATEFSDIIINTESILGKPNATKAYELKWAAYKINKVVENLISLYQQFDGRNPDMLSLGTKVTLKTQELVLLLKQYAKVMST